jgi:outer membrane lipoprotein-sorting protein
VTNSVRGEYAELEAGGDAATARVMADLDGLYRTQAPALTMPVWPAEHEPGAGRLRRLGHAGLRRPAWALAAVVGAVALVLAATNLGGTAGVSAETILEKAAAAISTPGGSTLGGRSYHMVTRVSYAGEGWTATETVETWYGDAEHFRWERSDGGSVFYGQARNGNDVWLYRSTHIGGPLRVAHAPTPPDPSGTLTFGVLIGQSTSLSEVLQRLRRDGCQTVARRGEDTIAGRAAYVVVVTPIPGKCPVPLSQKKDVPDRHDGPTTIWVDKETFLPLGSEQEGNEGNNYRVISLEVGAHARPASFAYQPPAGSTIFEVATLNDLNRLPEFVRD